MISGVAIGEVGISALEKRQPVRIENSAVFTSGSDVSTGSSSLSIPVAANMLVVFVEYSSQASGVQSVSTVTWAGVSLSLYPSSRVLSSALGTARAVEMWYLPAPPAASSQNVVVTMQGGSPTTLALSFQALALSGVDQANPFGTLVSQATSSTNASTVTATVTGSSMVLAAESSRTSTIWSSAGVTQRIVAGNSVSGTGANLVGGVSVSQPVFGTTEAVGFNWTTASESALLAIPVNGSLNNLGSDDWDLAVSNAQTAGFGYSWPETTFTQVISGIKAQWSNAYTQAPNGNALIWFGAQPYFIAGKAYKITWMLSSGQGPRYRPTVSFTASGAWYSPTDLTQHSWIWVCPSSGTHGFGFEAEGPMSGTSGTDYIIVSQVEINELGGVGNLSTVASNLGYGIKNLLPINDATAETTAGTWNIDSGATAIARSTGVVTAREGSAVIEVTCTGGTNASVATGLSFSGITVKPNTKYTIMVSVQRGASMSGVSSSVDIQMDFWDSGGTGLTNFTSSFSAGSGAPGTWTDNYFVGTSPANAAYGALYVIHGDGAHITAGNKFYIDRAGIFEGDYKSTASWVAPGDSNLLKRSGKALVAALTFVGSIVTNLIHAGGTAYTQALSGVLSFTGSHFKKSSRTLTAQIELGDSNLLTLEDSDFEGGTTGAWAPGTGSPTLTNDTTRSFTGSRALKITWPAVASASLSLNLTGLTVGKQYSLLGYYYTPTGGPNMGFASNLGGGFNNTTKDSWTAMGAGFTATATTGSIVITATTTPTAGTNTWIDAIYLTATPSTGPALAAGYTGRNLRKKANKANAGALQFNQTPTTPTIRGNAIGGAFATSTPTLSFNAASYSTAPVAGDLLIAFIGCNNFSNNTAPALPTPGSNVFAGSGWTNRLAYNDAQLDTYDIWTRTATGTSADNVTWSTTGDGSGAEADISVVMVAVSGVASATYGTVTGQPSGTTSFPSTGVGNAGDLLLYGATASQLISSGNVPAGMTYVNSSAIAGAGQPYYTTVASQTLGTAGTRTGVTGVTALGAASQVALTGSLTASNPLAKQIGRVLSAVLSFTGSIAKQTRRALAGALSFTGSKAWSARKALSGGLSFTGSVAASKTFVRALSGGLSFTGSQIKNVARSLAGVLSFTGSLAIKQTLFRALSGALSFTGSISKRTSRSLAGGLSFTGSHLKRAGKNLAAGLSFTGSQAKFITRPISAGLSFTGSMVKSTARAFSGGLSFTGSLAAGKNFVRALSGALLFTGSQTKVAGKNLTAGLSFSGSMAKRAAKNLSGGLTFTGSMLKLGGKNFAAGLSFTGSQTKFITKPLAGALSFLGNHARVLNGGGTAYTQGLSATLTFVGSAPKLLTRALAGVLSFTGSFLRTRLVSLTAALSFTGSIAKRTQRALSGSLSFVGSQAKQSGKSLTAGLSFSGSQARRAARALAGTLSFTGSQAKTTSRPLAGTLSFTGSITKAFVRALTGALSFTGSLTKQGRKNLTAGLSFVGSQTKNTLKALAGVLSFVGNLVGVKNGGATNYTQNLFAGLSFVGSRSILAAKALNGVLSFTGSMLKALSRSLAGALSFTGSISKRTGKALAGVLSFTGSQAKSFPVRFSGTLSFTGAVAKKVNRSLSATLSFTGSFLKTKAVSFAAGLSFVGSQTKRTGKALAGALSFTGTLNRAFPVRFTAALSFAGNVAKQTRRNLSAALSFAGSVSGVRLIIRAFTASLSFTGNIAKRTGKGLVGVLNFIPGFSYIAHILNPAPEITHPDVVVTSLSGDLVVTMLLGSVDGTDHAGSLVMASTGTSVLVTSASGDVQ